MTCRYVDLGGGNYAITCGGRGQRSHRCKDCGRDATLQCDFPLRGRKTGRTCSVYLCAGCATAVDGKDLCAPHARAWERQACLPLGEPP
jgi:hypothetical protein